MDSLNSTSSEDLDDIDIDIAVPPRKPHFLDYDAIPPPGFDDATAETAAASSSSNLLTSSGTNGCSGESVKVDKKYERDGEISDYELAASGVTKKEIFPQRKLSQNNERIAGGGGGARKKKHFLDENPIPPDYMLDKEREHRSLDRNFERQGEYDSFRYGRKHSLDREGRSRKLKEPSYTLFRFIEGDSPPACHSTWPVDRPIENSVNYGSLPPESMSNLGPKVECVYSLLSMLGSQDPVEMSKKFLELSRAPETCATLRQSGCIPLLVQMMHSDSDAGARKRAASALHNIVHCQPDDKTGRREAKVLRLIEQIMDYCSFLKSLLVSGGEAIADDPDRHPLAAVSSLMKVSFDEEHRHAMCQLGALQAIASLVHLDHAVHGPKPEDQCCNSLRRYALMALTNLTFGDGNNKALLCANKEFMEALVAQLDSAPDDLLQVTGSVLRNLSWRADNNMKAVLNEIGTVTALAKAAMKNKNENTLKSILSALWNLSAHCSTNKAEFCAVQGALVFLVDMLTYEGPSKTLTIIENAGGILRNVSSRIAVSEDYRKILRQRNCLGILLQQLKSESLTVVSNACGILWNLSARFPEDQKYLWDNGAVPMLRSLIHSKHKMISEGSSAALKNLLNFRPGSLNQNTIDPIAKSMGLKELPTLNARKQRTLEEELNQNLGEISDNCDAITPELGKHTNTTRLTRSAIVSKSESRDSIVSAKSDSIYEKYRRGHSAPPGNGDLAKDIKSHSFNLRNNFGVRAGFETDQETELPIDYSAKYNSEVGRIQTNGETVSHMKSQRKTESRNFTTYQETDLDQPTDFSLRYAENQVESDSDEKESNNPESNEIILILEDTVKCYETEGTPYAISNAASVSDLRNPKSEEQAPAPVPKQRTMQKHEAAVAINAYGSGTYTPEKPINYCEEGTPGYFSRYESLSSLDESPQNFTTQFITKTKPEVVEEETFPEGGGKTGTSPVPSGKTDDMAKIEAREPNPIASLSQSAESTVVVVGLTDVGGGIATVASNATKPVAVPSSLTTLAINSAHETPLMFSRRSSMDSLASVEPNTADDKSSVVSDFSRLASGIISPSELPDSPTQSMPQSPRRNSNVNPPYPSIVQQQTASAQKPIAQQRLRSVFEDDLNTFRVENTPAQFSCATSLSNLSLDDEPKITTDSLAKELIIMDDQSEHLATAEIKTDKVNIESCALTDGEEEINDNMLLATCINIGMNRGASSSKLAQSTNLSPSKKDGVKATTTSDDAVRQYFTEDTPALLSKVGSNSNLSALSINTNKCDNVNLSDESSVSDGGNDLLEQCIREGMQKSSSKQRISSPEVKDPIAMLRRGGGLPPYLPVGDEMNKFVVEDSPCNFSVISGLSGLTVGSGVVGPANIKRLVEKPTDQSQREKEQRQFAEDSLSSISIESEDDNNLLNQAIAAGCNKTKIQNENSANMPYSMSMRKLEVGFQQMHLGNFNDPNDSLSSIDSSDSNDNQAKSLFEQCIRTGMNKQKKPEKQVPKQVISPKRSQLPMLNFASKTPMQIDRDRHRERDRKDEQLLKECISNGMAPKGGGRIDSQIRPPVRHIRPVLASTEFNQRLVTGGPAITTQTTTVLSQQNQNVPKNGETTSVAVLEQQQQLDHTISHGAPNIAPGVGMIESPDGTSNGSRNHRPTMLRDQLQIENLQNIIGSELLQLSYGSLNLSDSNGLLEQSNEYPALKTSNIDYGEDSVHESSFEMEMSNEFLIEKDYDDADVSASVAQAIHDKHKDPDLMLKSVERLTHELVSTAEYLRTNASNNSEIQESQDFDSNNTIYEKKSGSNSNNTWNEDTCPNDVSFPSVSITAPMVASLNDDETSMSDINAISNKQFVEITPTNEDKTFMTSHHKDFNSSNFLSDELFDFPGPNSQPNSLETETDTLVNDEPDGSTHSLENKNDSSGSGIRFHVGGEVQPQLSATIPQFVSSGPMSFESCSTMSSSTIIAMEANKLAHQFMQNMVESTTSLDLDNIRPPSGMDCISLSGYDGIPLSPQLSRFRKKSLPPGLMAKRALGGGLQQPPPIFSGSVESVNSTYNLLDNIKPPSLMDELLDSMISVASITSEIVDNSLGTAQSNYETAFSDVDENTTTLQSCMDGLLPMDCDSNGTPIPSDFSSAESTPRKTRGNSNSAMGSSGVKRTLTPKQKRRIVKDRYKTYTIAADFVLKESFSSEQNYQTDEGSGQEDEDDEILKIEINHEPEENDDVRVVEERNVQADESANNNVVTSVKRRSLDPERYRTRTIVYNGEFETKSSADHTTYKVDPLSSADDTEEMSSIRAMTRQFKFITEPETTIVSDKKSSIFRMKLLDEETHRTESDFNSIEFDQNSETESCDQNLNRTDDETSPKRCNGPRIVKVPPEQHCTENGLDDSSNAVVVPETELKVVRGRKKPAYVSPYRKTAVSGSSTRTSSPKAQIGSTVIRANLSSRSSPDMKKTLAAKNVPKNPASASKTHVVVNRAGIMNKMNANRSGLIKPGFINGGTAAAKKNFVAEKNLINKRCSTETKTVKNTEKTEVKLDTSTLERQGTFVKDEPSVPEVPVVTSLPPSPGKSSKLPTKTASPKPTNIPKSPAKTGIVASKFKTPVQRSANTAESSKVSPKGLASNTTPRPRNITSSANDLTKRKTLIGVRKSPSVPTVPQRSNSNASIRPTAPVVTLPNTNPPSRSNSNLTTPRPVISRIAGIWKKSDDSGKKSAIKSATPGKPPIAASANTKLIRSSTFDNSPAAAKSAGLIPNSQSKSPKSGGGGGTTGIAMRKKDEAHPLTTVVRRTKVETSTTSTSPIDATTKRVSRLGTFINIEGDCQVAG